jgi:hypothetical protein
MDFLLQDGKENQVPMSRKKVLLPPAAPTKPSGLVAPIKRRRGRPKKLGTEPIAKKSGKEGKAKEPKQQFAASSLSPETPKKAPKPTPPGVGAPKKARQTEPVDIAPVVEAEANPPASPTRFSCRHYKIDLMPTDDSQYFKDSYKASHPYYPTMCEGKDCGRIFVDSSNHPFAPTEAEVQANAKENYPVGTTHPVYACINARNAEHTCQHAFCKDCYHKLEDVRLRRGLHSPVSPPKASSTGRAIRKQRSLMMGTEPVIKKMKE